ncbi:MAG: carboxypeptidase regulatory-like domain-containing protein [Candidatus Hydrogenedentes bacterium]|nr:carboxypeptidase regulatory-like domain-containing protein [Candidatus Hydrogenedentota bacterium]
MDIAGEELPGVAVTVEGTSYQTLTNAYGRYRVRYRPGRMVLEFTKTGYTSGRLALDANQSRSVQAATIALWRLPRDKGVYFYEDHKYRALARLEPERFPSTDGSAVYGTSRWTDVETTLNEPLIVCHRLPWQGITLHRLNLVEVTLTASENQTETKEVWAPAEALPIEGIPIDEPEALLLQVRLSAPLEEGVYAIDWGALTGATSQEKQMYVFSVVPALSPAPPAPESESAGESSSPRDTKETKPAPEKEKPKEKPREPEEELEPIEAID